MLIGEIETRLKMLESVKYTVVRYGMFNEKANINIMFSNRNVIDTYYKILVNHMILTGERIMNRNKTNIRKNRNDVNIAYKIKGNQNE